MKYSKYCYWMLVGFPVLVSCAVAPKLSTLTIPSVNNVDINRYAGNWFEIARLPQSFEKGLVNVTATYEIRPDGKISVINQGYKGSAAGKPSKAKGTAWIPDPKSPGVLKVRFFWPFTGVYKIINLDLKEYTYSVVTSNSKKYLWILSREPVMNDKTYKELVEFTRQNGFDVDKLIKVPQNWR